MCHVCNKQMTIENLIPQHSCYLKKCGYCKAMFLEDGDFQEHVKRCQTVKRMDEFGVEDIDKCMNIMAIISEDMYQNILIEDLPKLIKHGAIAIRKQKRQVENKRKLEEEERVSELPL